jgi:CBS domain containing-hemolysin-like protein
MTVLLLLAVVVLVLLNGFFVAAEFALVRVRRSRVEEEVDQGVKSARLVMRQLDDLSRYLAACQLGITLTSLGIGFLGEPAIAAIFENMSATACPHAVSLTISIGLAYLISTSLHITIGEQVPKIYAINKAEPVARADRPAARPVHPRVQPLHRGAQQRLQRDAPGRRDQDERRVRGRRLPRGAQGADRPVARRRRPRPQRGRDAHRRLPPPRAAGRQVMTPAPAVITVDTSEDVETALRRCISSGHTRIVVTRTRTGPRQGIIHANALARC